MKTILRASSSDERGFSLVEAMVAMVIAVIISASLYFLYNHQHKQYLSEQNVSEMQSNGRFILDAMGRDLLLAGYRPVNQPGLIEGFDHQLTFEYWDDKAEADATYDKHRRITYRVDTSTPENAIHMPLYRAVSKYNTALLAYDSVPQNYTVGEYVTGLTFHYYDGENNLMAAPGTNLSQLQQVRSIQVEVSLRSHDTDPFFLAGTPPTPQYRTLTLKRTYQSRNLGIAANPTDKTPPAAPTGLACIDPRICGQLIVRWNANTETDLAGYYLFVGQEPGTYVEKFKVPKDATSYTLTDHTSTKSTDGTPVTYYMMLKAFDKSANNSDASAEIWGDPHPDVTDFSLVESQGNDTTINPAIPIPPANFDASNGAVENQVVLTWQPSPSSDLVKYLLYRSTTPGFTPSGTAPGMGNCIASLDPTAVGYTDTGYPEPRLIGCTSYYYKIAGLNCDETLIPSYAATDFSECYGDGAVAAIENDFPQKDITDSTPADTVPTESPMLSSHAGWKRVFLSLTNPNLTDDPDFQYTNIWWNKGSGFPQFLPGPDGQPSCTIDTSRAQLVPDHGGVFTLPGSGTSFKHDSETLEEPPEPSLENMVTYYYRAVAYDKCGNCSSVTGESTTLSELCGDDPPGLPQCFPAVHLAPDAEGCYGYLRLAWGGDCLKEGTDLNRDFSGFHVYRNEGPTYSPGAPGHVELTSGVPQWYQTFVDATAVEGKMYSYAIRWADCAYEHENLGNISDPIVNGGLLEGLAVGQLRPDNSNILLTGDLNVSPPTYEHNVVRFTLLNSSAGPMTIDRFSLSWENPLAFLRRVVIGDNSTTSRTVVWQDGSLPLTMGNTGGTLSIGKSIDGLDQMVPVELHFANANGSVDYNCDMREDHLQLLVNYTNPTTGTNTCARSEYLTVPLGPTVTRSTQNRPTAATLSWAVPGYSGTNSRDQVVVRGGVPVTIHTFVHDYSGSGIKAVTLYYYSDPHGTLLNAPAYDGTNYTAIPMTLVSGDLWRTPVDQPLPPHDDHSIWYFIVAEDNQGNFDREPEVRAGAFQFYQQLGHVCDNTPRPPGLTGMADLSSVDLAWTPPLLNTDESAVLDLAGYKIYRYDGTSWSLLADLESPDILQYTDTPPQLDVVNYSYYVTTYDTCAPVANESSASNVFAECIGAPPCLLSVQAIGPAPGEGFNPGDSFNINLTVCDRINGLPGELLYAQSCSSGTGDTDSIRLVEAGDTGSFSIDPGYGRTHVRTYLSTYPVVPTDVDLRVTNGDTITVGAYSDVPYLDGAYQCLTPPEFCDYETIAVVVDPCLGPVTPSEPLNLAATTSSNCNASNPNVSLTWSTPASGTVSFYNIYRCQGAGCIPSGTPIATSTFTSFTDSPPARLANIFRYRVTAVNAACATNIRESAPSNVAQQCP